MHRCLVIQSKNLSYKFGKLGLLCSTDALLVSCFLLMLLTLKLPGQQQLQQGRRGLEEVGVRGGTHSFCAQLSWLLAGAVGPRVTLADQSTWHYAFSGLFLPSF